MHIVYFVILTDAIKITILNILSEHACHKTNGLKASSLSNGAPQDIVN